MSKRAAIYARFSTDLQRDASIDDQVRTCRTRAEQEGFTVVEVFADYAISGASALRPQWQAMLAAAREGRIDAVLAEGLDRFSRDQEHIAAFYKQLSFADVRIITVAEGEISELHVGLKGTMNALFLKDLGIKTHRGIEGRVRAGHSGGGLSFGYQVPRRLRPDGTLAAGDMEIVESEAAIIRTVFNNYVSGLSPRAVAKDLNADGVPGPRGGKWTASLILGNATRETGLLRNRLYAGERVWNRQHFIKDPASGKRVARPNPKEAWVITQVPNLRIIDADLWQAAQARLAKGRAIVTKQRKPSDDAYGYRPNMGARLVAARRPQWLLSGLVRCGVCNGPMGVVANEGRLGCANRRERGTCSNSRTLLRGRLLERVLDGLKHRLLAPELVELFVRQYVTEANAANRTIGHQQAKLTQEHSRGARQIRNLLELIKDGHGSPAMVQELRDIEQRQTDIAAQICAAGIPEPLPVLHPNLPELYRRKVEAIEVALREPAAAAPAADALRSLIDAILVYPGEKRGEVRVELRGDLAAFLHLADVSDGPHSKTAVLLVGNGRGIGVMGSLVAGTRNRLDLLLTAFGGR